MSAIYPLSNLQDASAFLAGALLPITDIEPEHPDDRWFWLRDHLIRINGEDPLPVILERVQQIPLEGGEGLALDLSEADTARWVDRKIAEALGASPSDDPILAIQRGCWVLDRRSCDENRIIRLDLGSIPCTPAHASTARSALLSALFGRAKS